MKKQTCGALIFLVSALSLMAANNYVDTGGTWGFRDSDGNILSGADTQYKIEQAYNATEFYTQRETVGNLFILNATETTTVHLEHYLANNSHIYATGFTDLNIVATNTGTGMNRAYTPLQISGGNNLSIDGGTYTTFRSDAEVARITVTSNVFLNNTTFIGDAEANRVKDTVLVIAANSLVVNNDSDEGDEYFLGSWGGTWTRAVEIVGGGEYIVNTTGTSGDGGDALSFVGTGDSSFYSTNMNAGGGTSRTVIWSGTERYEATTIGATDGIGGNGVEITATQINIDAGFLYGGTGHSQQLNDIDQTGATGMTSTGGNGAILSGTDIAIKGLLAVGGDAGYMEALGSDITLLTFTGGNAMNITTASSTNANVTGSFYGGDAGTATAEGNTQSITFTGGNGINSSGSGFNFSGRLLGGYGGDISISSNTTSIVATGGDGGSGVFLITDGDFDGGDGAEVSVGGSSTSITADGGNGLTTTGASSILDGDFTGGNGGDIKVDEGIISTLGGSGVHQNGGTLNIYGGQFEGGQGGSVLIDSTSVAGGHGLTVENGTLNLMGGTFTAGYGGRSSNERSSTRGAGISSLNSHVTLDGANVVINGGLDFENTSASTAYLNLNSGTINGTLTFYGTGRSEVTVSNTMSSIDSVNVDGGNVAVRLIDPETSKYFNRVHITDGSMVFEDNIAELASSSRYTLYGTNSTLTFSQGAILGTDASIDVGQNSVITTSGDLDLKSGANIYMSYATSIDTNGVSSMSGGTLNIAGNLILTNSSTRLHVSGISAKPEDVIQLTTGGVTLNANDLDDVVSVDFGWLVKTDLSVAGGIKATLSYNDLMSGDLSDIDSAVLASVETHFSGLSETEFYEVNSAGSSATRYAISQIPDTSESSFQINQAVNNQIAARGTEYRSMNGFASSKPTFGNSDQPTGVAGPNALSEKNIQGWIRAYGIYGSKDASKTFSSYDSSGWGTIVGIDKDFGNILIGIAGGYAETDLDSDSYDAEMKTYHASIYSTIGLENIFLDLSATYGLSDTKETNQTESDSFDSDIFSLYAGAGISFNLIEKVTITPEVSLLASYYTQEEFNRSGKWGSGTVEEYDTTSFLSSIGVNLSSIHQLDWHTTGLAFIPEIRLHWLHEFNADPDDFQYNVNSVGSLPFAVRPRDENTFRIGTGIDIWSWKHQNSKFELDYDALISDSYFESIVSGKITFSF
ncbi:MAG: autotransporter domain-containing protein [Pontiella sp.]